MDISKLKGMVIDENTNLDPTTDEGYLNIMDAVKALKELRGKNSFTQMITDTLCKAVYGGTADETADKISEWATKCYYDAHPRKEYGEEEEAKATTAPAKKTEEEALAEALAKLDTEKPKKSEAQILSDETKMVYDYVKDVIYKDGGFDINNPDVIRVIKFMKDYSVWRYKQGL